MKDILELLTEIEEILDKTNADYGNKNEYDSKVGIKHLPNCIILTLREEIKEEKEFDKVFNEIWDKVN